MGKLYNVLQKQLKTTHKDDAENCIKIYNKLKETTGHVWESEWIVLTTVTFEGVYPNLTTIYKPSKIGKCYINNE